MMRREIDNPDAFEAMRHLYAAVQTEVVQEAGLNIRYTALSNVERGLPNAPQQHLGSARTARVRRGERDAVNEPNWEKSLAGEAALLDERLRHAQEAEAAEIALLDRVDERAAPMLVAISPVPVLSIAAPLRSVSTIGEMPQAVLTSGDNPFAMPMTLPVADLQPVPRAIVVSPAMTAVTAESTLPVIQGLPAVRIRQHRLSAVSTSMGRAPDRTAPPLSASAVAPKLPVPTISAPSRFAAALTKAAAGHEIGLATGVVRHSDRRVIDVPKPALALEGSAVDQDVQQVFELLEQREAEAMARRDRLRRQRQERQRAEADRLRQQQEDERRRKDERQQREAEDARRAQAEDEAAAALDAMLNAVQAERILIAFDNSGRCVVGDTVLARFNVAPDAVAARSAQVRLDDIADRQGREIERLGVYLASHAGDAIHEPAGWTLSANAPADLRRIADAWRHESALQKAIADTAAAFRASQSQPRTRMRRVSAPVPGAPSDVRRGAGPVRAEIRLPAHSPSRQQVLAAAAAQREVLTRQWEQDRGPEEMHPGIGSLREPQKPVPSPVRQPVPTDRGQGR